MLNPPYLTDYVEQENKYILCLKWVCLQDSNITILSWKDLIIRVWNGFVNGILTEIMKGQILIKGVPKPKIVINIISSKLKYPITEKYLLISSTELMEWQKNGNS